MPNLDSPSSSGPEVADYSESVVWKPHRPRLQPFRLAVAWVGSALGILIAAYIVPGDSVEGFFGALIVAALVAILNAFVPPVIAAIRLPYTVGLGFILVLVADALMLMAASAIAPGAIHIPSLGRALWTALVAAVVSVVLDVVLGTNDDDAYTVRVTQRVAKRSGERHRW